MGFARDPARPMVPPLGGPNQAAASIAAERVFRDGQSTDTDPVFPLPRPSAAVVGRSSGARPAPAHARTRNRAILDGLGLTGRSLAGSRGPRSRRSQTGGTCFWALVKSRTAGPSPGSPGATPTRGRSSKRRWAASRLLCGRPLTRCRPTWSRRSPRPASRPAARARDAAPVTV